MTVQQTLLAWTRSYFYRGDGEVPGTQIAYYRLSDLINKGVVAASEGRALLLSSGLLDLVWQGMAARNDPTPDVELEERIGSVQGYAVFMLGWPGNHSIWE